MWGRGRGWGEKESPSVNPTGSKLIQLLLVISYLVMVIHGHLLLVQKLKLIINVVKSHDFYSGLNQKNQHCDNKHDETTHLDLNT